ncbi:MAG: alpha/beta hydrolase [Betaproteobacteria bacterium]|nr:alpha/beta hydrolase [Betaproteobacteria bacterium]
MTVAVEPPGDLLPAIEIETGKSPQFSIIWMHGLGADGSDFVPVVRELELPARRAIRFVFPHAPLQPVTINGGYVMRAWYDIAYTDLGREADERGIRQSQARVEQLIARENSRGVAARCIVLAGFSQGGVMALHTGLRYPERLAGILSLSGYLALEKELAEEASAANRGTPVFMAHGTEDAVVPCGLGRASRERLEKLGYAVLWREYPMPHSVCLEEIEEIGTWLKQVLQ